MALKHRDRVTKLVVIDIVPTYKLLHSLSNEVAAAETAGSRPVVPAILLNDLQV